MDDLTPETPGASDDAAAYEADLTPPGAAPQAPAPAAPMPDGASGLPPAGLAGSPTPGRRGPGIGLIVTLAIAVGLVAGALGGYAGQRLAASGGTLSQITVLGSTTQEPVAAAAAAALPSIVNVNVTENTTSAMGSLPQGHPSVPVSAEGSGIAYKSAGPSATYVITNNHVVTAASKIVVVLPSGERVTAKVVGGDPETDIAVIDVPKKLPLIGLGDSEQLVVGQLVVTIGSPYGLQQSVSGGVVSAIHRSLPDRSGDDSSGVYPLIDVIQTDAAINPGNSGGALIDRAGKLVGVNSAIYSDTGEGAGIGFAIPVKTAARIADELISRGRALHPYLGVLGETVDDALAKEKKLSVAEGALVISLTPRSGAEAAGVRPGDVIVKLDSSTIRSMDDLLLAVRRTKVGQKVQLTVLRGKQTVRLTVTIGDKPGKI